VVVSIYALGQWRWSLLAKSRPHKRLLELAAERSCESVMTAGGPCGKGRRIRGCAEAEGTKWLRYLKLACEIRSPVAAPNADVVMPNIGEKEQSQEGCETSPEKPSRVR
jgi:hypothetical protein